METIFLQLSALMGQILLTPCFKKNEDGSLEASKKEEAKDWSRLFIVK